MKQKLTKKEKIDKIDQAQDLLQEVIDLLQPIADDDPYFKHYFLDYLVIMKGENDFLTQDLNLDKMKEQIRREEN